MEKVVHGGCDFMLEIAEMSQLSSLSRVSYYSLIKTYKAVALGAIDMFL